MLWLSDSFHVCVIALSYWQVSRSGDRSGLFDVHAGKRALSNGGMFSATQANNNTWQVHVPVLRVLLH